jgi:hypothetical protein
MALAKELFPVEECPSMAIIIFEAGVSNIFL